MANKKSTIKKTKKQSANKQEKNVDKSIKDIFVAEAQNVTFTEEDLKKDEEERQRKAEEEAAHKAEEEAVANETIEEEIVENDHPLETETEAVPEVEETLITEDAIHIPFVQIVGEENNSSGEVTVAASYSISDEKEVEADAAYTVEPQPKKESVKPKKRSTSKDVYGYHWMGLIYDE